MTIKETAGKTLLYFYQLQRTVPLTMRYRQLGFIDRKNGGLFLTSDKKWLTNNLLDINPASIDILNAFIFLIDKGFIESKERATTEARVYVGIQLTHKGIDIVEGVESGEDGRRIFNSNFNINVAEGTTIEQLIDENLSTLLEN
ncbi:MAG: hypothetical protein V4611_01780 [Patescibacteria group bacterium]